jgi:hypothetical protein
MISDIVQRLENLPPNVLHEFLKDLVLFMYRGGCAEFGADYDPVNGSIESTSEFPSGSDVCDAIAQNIEEMGILAPSKLPSRLYQVVAIYADNNQRYCDEFWATSPQDAEAAAKAKAAGFGNELIIAGVFLDGKVVA